MVNIEELARTTDKKQFKELVKVITLEKEEITEQSNIPQEYKVEGNWLYRIVKSKKDDEQDKKFLITATVPTVVCEYRDIENGDYSFNVTFMKNNKLITLTLTSEDISQKAHIIKLAKKGIDVYESNAVELIKYINAYKRSNSIPIVPVAMRLGHVANKFISPYKSDRESTDVLLVTIDAGYKSLLAGFKQKGTLKAYAENVFSKVKELPMVMSMIYGSLGSVLLHDFGLEPFVIDLSGRTSSGKSFTLKVATSVWGNDKLITEWNSTKNSVETQATFLNSFPLVKDDTRKAGKKMVVDSVYNFSGGKSKTRSNTSRTVDEIKTWKNIMLSTGETSIPDIAEEKAGVSGRTLTLQQAPYPNGFDFRTLAEAIDSNHGVLGKSFIEQYNKRKQDYMKQFKDAEIYFIKKANDNEVMIRMARPFALLRTVGEILSDINGFEHDPYLIIGQTYEAMINENKNIDKPKQMLEDLLTKLVSSDYEILKVTNYHLPKERADNNKKIIAYQHLDYLAVDKGFVEEFLGVERNSITKQWKERDFLIFEGRGTTKKVSTYEKRRPMFCFRSTVINEAGYDFYNVIPLKD